MSFLGNHEHTLDEKGRTSVPSRFRDEYRRQVGDGSSSAKITLVISRSNDGCLVVWPLDRWLVFERKILALKRLSRKAKQLKRVFIAHAEETSIDKSGRILVPPAMREFAGIQRNVIWVGMIDNCELWEPERWHRAMDDLDQEDEALTNAFEDLDL